MRKKKKKQLTAAERIYNRLVSRPVATDEFGEYDRFADADTCIKIIGNHTDTMQALNDSQAETIERLEKEKAELVEATKHLLFLFDRDLPASSIGKRACNEAREIIEKVEK